MQPGRPFFHMGREKIVWLPIPHFCSVWFGETMCERVGDVQRPTFSELLNAKKRSFTKLEASVNLQIPLLF